MAAASRGVTIVVQLCTCSDCRRFERTLPNQAMYEFTFQSYDFAFQFPRIKSEIGDGDRCQYNLNPVTSIFEDIDNGIPRTVGKTAEVIRFVTYKDFDHDGFVLPLTNFAVICDLLMEDDLQAAIRSSDVASDFLQRISRWFVYSWHAFQHNRPEAEWSARKFRKFMAFLVGIPIVASEALQMYSSTTLWPVIGPTEILEQLCNNSLLCSDTVSLLCNLTRIRGFPAFLNERSSCVTIIKDRLLECCLKMLDADELGGLLLLLMVNLAAADGFVQFLIESNAGYFMKVVMLELISNTGPRKSIECATWQLLKNLSLVAEGREMIMADIDKFLGPILLPITGPETMTDEEMGNLPVDVLYLDDNKKRTENYLVKECILDLLFALCRFRKDRIVIRDFDTYQILKRYHIAETDPELLEKIESVVNVLIRTEDEIGLDDMMAGLKIADDNAEVEASALGEENVGGGAAIQAEETDQSQGDGP